MSGFGFGYGFHKSSTVVAGYDADAQAYFDAVPDAFDAARKTIINTLVTTLKTDGNWTKLDRLWLFANTTTGNAIIDIKGLSSATLVNSPTFTADQGYKSNGTTSYINSNFNYSTDLVAASQNSISQGVYSRTDIAGGEAGSDMGIYNVGGSSVRTNFLLKYTNGDAYISLFTTAASVVNHSNPTTGLYVANRTASNLSTLYINGSSIGTTSDVSTTPDNGNTFILCYNNANTGPVSFSNKQISICFVSSGTLGQSDFYTAIQTYMTSLGTQV